MTIPEERMKQAATALRELEEAVYHTVLDHNYAKRSLTEDFSFELGLTKPEDIAIIRIILNKLKVRGLVENVGENEDCWCKAKQQQL